MHAAPKQASTSRPARRCLARLAVVAGAIAAWTPQAGAYTINGTYYNTGTWNDSLYVSTTGYFINMPGGVLESSLVMNVGKLENRLGGVVNNYTRLLNATSGFQTFYNYGVLNSFSGSSFENSAWLYNVAGASMGSSTGASMVNLGFFSNAGSWVNAGSYEQRYENITGAAPRKLVNSGSLVNAGVMTIKTKTSLENSGSLTNSGTLNSMTTALSNSGTWTNEGALNLTGDLSVGTTAGLAVFSNTGSFTNAGTLANVNGTVKNYGVVVNDGTMGNTSSNWIGDWGRFYNYAGASLVNHGSFNSNHVLDNAGSISNTGTLSVLYMLNNLAGARLSNAAGASIKGATYNYGTLDNWGSIEYVANHGVMTQHAGASQHNAQLDNYGTYTLEAGAGLSGAMGVSNAAGATLVNNGSMYHWYADLWGGTTSNAGTLLNTGSLYNARPFYNSGTLDNRGSMSGNGRYIQTGGATLNAGTLNQASVEILAGSFQGAGAVQAASFSNSGTVAPGADIGLLAIDGDYLQMPAGLLAIELAGLQPGAGYDQLVIGGSAVLAGGLGVHLLNWQPAADDAFNIVHAAGGLSGSFETLALPALDTSLSWRVDYTQTDVWLRVTAVPEPGSAALLGLGLAALARRRRALPGCQPAGCR